MYLKAQSEIQMGEKGLPRHQIQQQNDWKTIIFKMNTNIRKQQIPQ